MLHIMLIVYSNINKWLCNKKKKKKMLQEISFPNSVIVCEYSCKLKM